MTTKTKPKTKPPAKPPKRVTRERMWLAREAHPDGEYFLCGISVPRLDSRGRLDGWVSAAVAELCDATQILAKLCPKYFERITGLRLNPGEVVEVEAIDIKFVGAVKKMRLKR